MELNEEKELFICANYLLISFFSVVFLSQLVLHRVLQIAIIELLLEIEWKIVKLDVVELKCRKMRKKISYLYRVNQYCFSRSCCRFKLISKINQMDSLDLTASNNFWLEILTYGIKQELNWLNWVLNATIIGWLLSISWIDKFSHDLLLFSFSTWWWWRGFINFSILWLNLFYLFTFINSYFHALWL